MSIFLRWGIFGILGVAALLYAYNTSKHLAETHARNAPATTATQTSAPKVLATPAIAADPRAAPLTSTPDVKLSPRCSTELTVAQSALEARRQGQPLDRLLRIPEIAWQDSAERRNRLVKVATDWFDHEGDWKGDALRIAVVSDCEQHAPPAG
jgi:hypothetical protein